MSIRQMSRTWVAIVGAIIAGATLSAQLQQPGTLPAHVIVDSCSGCGGSGSGVTDADDASIAAGQTGVGLSLGLTMVYDSAVWRRLTFGQAAMVSSIPVVIASNQSAIPVTGTFFQATQPVSAVSLPLPSNAASETGGNLATIKTNTDKLDIALSALRDALRGASSKTLTDVVTALTGLSVSITGSVAVTGPLTDTQLRATPVPVSGTVAATQSGTWTVQPGNTANTTAWKVDGSAVTQPVSGTFWQLTQPISAATLPLPSAASTSTKQSDGSQKTQVVDGAGNVIGATTNALDINIKSGNPATMTATQATGSNLHVVVDTAPSTAVTVASLPLPSNAAIETGGNLATIAGKDFATSAKQDTGNTSLASIKTDVDRIPAQGAALTAASLPVNIASDQTVIVKTTGLDPATSTAATLAVTQGGVAWVNVLTTGSGLPLPTCNPVRRTNCAAKGF
jgi:hypothetical protein